MNKLRVRLFIVGCAGLLLALSTAGHAEEMLPRFEPWDCPVDVPSSPPIECGYLVVPEDYDEPEGSTIRLLVVIIHSRSQTPAPDPILYTEGGPGYSSLSSVWWLAGSEFLNSRDAVVLEQRGNLYAQPSLDCDLSVWSETDPDRTPCLDSLKEKGIDLSQYTTAVIAADIDALRQVLGYEEWNLYGSSYSTRLMQLTMHLHPEGIRSVILQSTSPLNDTRYEHDPEHVMRVLQVMFDDCAADSGCAAAYPELEAQLYRVIRKLNAEPVAFAFTDSETGEPYTETVDGERLLGWMVTDVFYSPARPPHKTAYMPLLIDQVDQGKTDLLLPWLDDNYMAFTPIAILSGDCTSLSTVRMMPRRLLQR
jgi:pimeloyl-ACP methyl ester carboxylesterase